MIFSNPRPYMLYEELKPINCEISYGNPSGNIFFLIFGKIYFLIPNKGHVQCGTLIYMLLPLSFYTKFY
jgi:hypothetical protein